MAGGSRISRRRFLQRSGTYLGGAALASALVSCRASEDERAVGALACPAPLPPALGYQPNVVLIMADDLGYGDVGAYGQRQILTPHLDRMAAEGLRFTDAYAGSTVCRPSRSTLMTGTHAGHTRVRLNSTSADVHLRDEDETVAELLRCAGYRNGLYGKWALGQAQTTGEPSRQGFDDWFGYLDQTRAHNYYPSYLWDNGERRTFAGNASGDEETYSADVVTDEAIGFIKAASPQPFFLYVPYTLPHANNALGAETGNGMQVPSDERYSDQPWPEVERAFAAAVTRLDADVGRLLLALADAGLDDSTLVIFTSDNGPHNEGGHSAGFFESAGELRGRKRDLYEGGIRVPTIARWPGVIRPGSTSNFAWSFPDVLPTLCELAGVRTPPGLDGSSLVSTLLGQPPPAREFLYWEFQRGQAFLQAVRFDGWKAVRQSSIIGSGRGWFARPGTVELYDLEGDPGETTNLRARAGHVERLVTEMFEASHTPSPEYRFRRFG